MIFDREIGTIQNSSSFYTEEQASIFNKLSGMEILALGYLYHEYDIGNKEGTILGGAGKIAYSNAGKSLVKLGLAEKLDNGLFSITEQGRRVAESELMPNW